MIDTRQPVSSASSYLSFQNPYHRSLPAPRPAALSRSRTSISRAIWPGANRPTSRAPNQRARLRSGEPQSCCL